jgi:hypothetical protein
MARTRRVPDSARRYGYDHRKLRDRTARTVNAGGAQCAELICLMPDRWIPPGTRWDLAHAADGSYLGPAHARCNRAEAARRGNRTRHGHGPSGGSYTIRMQGGDGPPRDALD